MTSSIIVECLVLLIFFYFASSPATCSIYEVDLRALLSFKENIIDPRGALDSWRYNETVSYCTWTGISCGSRHRNRVVSIDLNSQGLAGFVSPHLGNLSFIRGINLQNNSFHGPIPQELGRLRRLEYLVLSNNSFDGEIPKNLSQCQNLYFLNLVDNVLTGNVPFKLSSLMKLEVLILSKNNLSGGNRFTGPMPKNLGKLSDLWGLFMGSANIQDDINFISSLTNCTKLKNLEISNNFFTGLLPHTIANLSTHLSMLAMGSNMIHGTIPSGIGDLTTLSVLVLEYNLFGGPIPLSIGRLTKLQETYLSANKFTGKLPSSLGNLTLLNTLYMGINNISGSIPPSLGSIPFELGSLRNVGGLYFSDNRLSGVVPSTIGVEPFERFTRVGPFKKQLFRVIPSFLGELSLAKLNLSFNKLRGPVPVDGVFRNVSAMLLEGNTELCGGISELKLPPCPPMIPKKKNSHIPLNIIVPVSISGAIFIAIIAFSYIFIQCKTKSRDDLYASPFESQFPRLSYADLLRATDGFSEANMIGLGRFGSVYKGIINDGDITVAVKVLNLHIQGAHKSFTRECNVLRGVRHRNLLKILSISVSTDYQGNEFTSLIYEFKGNGSLNKWLHLDTDGQHENTRYLTLMQRLNIAIDVASALEYLHNGTASTIVHGDLKPSNILLDDDMTAHVGDFGLAKVISNVSSGLAANESHSVAVKGTIGYIAPEYGMVGTVSTHGDIYSYGILLLELFTNIRPTSEVLSANASLHNFVAAHLELDRAMEIVDPLILQKERHMINSSIRGCVASILGIGVACSRKLPQDRMAIANVVSELGRVRIIFLAQNLSVVRMRS
ncbi:UNVERIFIED_CONTAM: putative LRR receptor-like serine/threonine-protein kinase [Sesamum radiatum]|uniref:non-specific serine/threonine protein kinase n=1 Tax=Sesamum radiatum TaxID=300843 RepID=A0AAW2PGP8_SESRA